MILLEKEEISKFRPFLISNPLALSDFDTMLKKPFVTQKMVNQWFSKFSNNNRKLGLTNSWVVPNDNVAYVYERIKHYVNSLKKQNRGKFPKGCKVIYKVVTGSQSFGLATPTSDIDIKGVYVQDNWMHGLFDEEYLPVIVVNKDETYFEIKHYLKLLLKGDALALEMLFSNRDMVIHESKRFTILKSFKESFLTKKLYYTFINYALGQFKKATNYNRKANWDDSDKIRRSPAEFTMYYDPKNDTSMKFFDFLNVNGIPEDEITLTKMDGFPNTFKVYHFKSRGWYTENSNELRTGEIPLEIKDNMLGLITFNHSEYSKHCKRFKEYKDWLINRNDERYNTNKEHAQNYDAKNVLHTVRLIITASEIPVKKTLTIDRSAERDYLLSIKKGEVDLGSVLDEWVEKGLNQLVVFEESDLPNEPNLELVKNYLKCIRLKSFKNFKIK